MLGLVLYLLLPKATFLRKQAVTKKGAQLFEVRSIDFYKHKIIIKQPNSEKTINYSGFINFFETQE